MSIGLLRITCDSTNGSIATNDLWARLAGGGIELHPIQGSTRMSSRSPTLSRLPKSSPTAWPISIVQRHHECNRHRFER